MRTASILLLFVLGSLSSACDVNVTPTPSGYPAPAEPRNATPGGPYPSPGGDATPASLLIFSLAAL
jgi:hypothetical protein